MGQVQKTADKAVSLAQGKVFLESRLAELYSSKQVSGLLQEALAHHFQAGGSRTRALLTYLFARTLELSTDDAVHLGCAVEALHNASLIHDDLQDNDPIRRGAESVWKRFGTDVAICAGDYLISAAYNCLSTLSKPERAGALIGPLHQAVKVVTIGQLDDLGQDKAQSLTSYEEYQRISAGKSGPLLALTLTLPLRYTGLQAYCETATTVFTHYAMAYQIYDDLQDVEKDQAKQGQHAGVNLVTVYQRQGLPKPAEAAQTRALMHLKQANYSANDLPEALQAIITQEVSALEKKLFQAN